MKKIVRVFLGLIISFGLILGSTAMPASAEPGCATQAEFKKVKNGMNKKQVAKLFGTKGELFMAAGKGRYRVEVRSYTACTEFGSVSIGFTGGKVDSKTGLFF